MIALGLSELGFLGLKDYRIVLNRDFIKIFRISGIRKMKNLGNLVNLVKILVQDKNNPTIL